MRVIAAEAWIVLQQANRNPFIFQRGQLFVDILKNENAPPVLRTLSKTALTGILDRLANFVKVDRFGDLVPYKPPSNVVDDMLAIKDPPLPTLLGIVESPIFIPPGILVTNPGYQPETRYYLQPPKDLTIPYLSCEPDDTSVQRAKRFILEDLIADFPFDSEGDVAHAVEVMLLPFVRQLIDGPTPLHLFESPVPGTGKGLLAEILTTPAAGNGLAVMTEPGEYEDEWRKRLTSKLLQGPPFILIDNIKNSLNSANLAAVLTAQIWEDRILGQSKMATLPVTTTWLATANNPVLSDEIARRTVTIRIVPPTANPWERTDFKHPNLRRWTKEHRGELIWSALTLIQAWIAEGQPKGGRILGSFESWAETMGGILQVAEIPGFLENRQHVYAEVDPETSEWLEFISVWWGTFREQPVRTLWLLTIARKSGELPHLWEGQSESTSRTRMGQAVARIRDRVMGNFRVVRDRVGGHTKRSWYRLEEVSSMTD